MTNYNDSLDRTASQIRNELSSKIREAIAENQEVFIAVWLKQNPDVDISKVVMCHGFKGDYYTFWVQEKEDV